MMAASDTAAHRGLHLDGFALLPALASADELAELRDAVAARVAGPHDDSCIRPHNTLLPLRWDDPIIRLLLSDAGRVAAVRAATDAEDLRWISGYLSIKDARTPPLWWHQDWWCWDHPVSFRPAPPQVALLLYLSDTHRGNGALRVLPRSHHRSCPIHAVLPEAHGGDAASLDSSHAALADLPGQATLSLRAGDAVVLDYRLLHGTHANAGDLRRDGLLLTFTPSWRGLPEDLRGHLIDHSALPSSDETAPAAAAWESELLPRFAGSRATLPLNRVAPREFAIGA